MGNMGNGFVFSTPGIWWALLWVAVIVLGCLYFAWPYITGMKKRLDKGE